MALSLANTMKKHLLQTISLFELLLVAVLGILSNKISDLLQINQTYLWILTLFVVTVLAIITIYKNSPDNSSSLSFIRPKVSVRITKKNVGSILEGVIYFPSALMLSIGAFHYSQIMDKDWLGILSGSAISGVLLFAPLLLDHVKEENQSVLPITIGFLLSVIYGSVGMYLDFFPKTIDENFVFLAIISAITFVGLKYVFVYYTILTWFGKWYQTLPEE
jgi:hypothetical protein